MRSIYRFLPATLLLCTVCVGCGEDWKAETYPASGSVTVNGDPPTGAIVHLYPTDKKVDVRNSRPWGLVQSDGSYVLTTYESGDGAPAGEYHFTIVWPPDPSVPSPTDRLGYRYSRPEQSEWKVTVAEGDNVLPPVEITGARLADQPSSAAPANGPPIAGSGSR